MSTQDPDVTETTTEDVSTQDEAESLGNTYLPFVDAAYMGANDPQAGQAELNKHIEGWTYQKSLSTPENQVFYRDSDSDAIVVAPGTRTLGDVAKNWVGVMSEEQHAVASLAAGTGAKFFPGVAAATTGAYNFMNAISGTQSAEERIDSMHNAIDLVKRERGADAAILLIGHSLGGYIARKTAQESGLSSVIYNSAIGRGRVYRRNTTKNVELRIRGDVVSGTPWAKQREWTLDRGLRDPLSAHRTEQFAADPAFYQRVRGGEVVLQRKGTTIEREYFRAFTDPSIHRDFVDRTCKPGYRRVGGVCVRY